MKRAAATYMLRGTFQSETMYKIRRTVFFLGVDF